ncbi:hypothetical protein IQ241_18475 [Romeria aff. gracilis LEGE 07310]|uniref:Uncharacterized protein n=1 Tax=Vasconcelosia minhoensis LEGE 07310 TaxID=915328 RepID=A0A8J7AKA8_9CYAN|nr:hypothetical protein [Romeria aff. gracilis LEGE 07310]
MLYLAEVQRKSGFIGSSKAEFKFLACQRSEQNWSAVPGDEHIPAPDDATYGAGALVMVELTNSRQIQRHYEAGRSLVNILQNFSSLSKKFKTQEDEIEQWKQSLTYQSQELNRREMEIEVKQEEIEQAAAELDQVAIERNELEQHKAEVEELRIDLERKNSELEGAWAHLNGEIQRFEERQAAGIASSGLDEQQMQQVQMALEQLMGTVMPTESVREHVTQSFDLIAQQQAGLDQHWQALEQKQSAVGDRQHKLSSQSEALDQQKQSVAEAESQLQSAQVTQQQQQARLEQLEQQSQTFSQQIEAQNSLHQRVYDLLNASDQVRLGKKVDVSALEEMPIEALQSLVSDLEQDLDKMSRFVSDQEEELKLEQQAIDELGSKIAAANEYDRMQLEAEMTDEKDRYQMLNQTLVGQRRNLQERGEMLSQHRAVLLRRQGHAIESENPEPADLEPVLTHIDEMRQQLAERVQQLDAEAAGLRSQIESCQQEVERGQQELDNQRQALHQAEAQFSSQQAEVVTLQGQIQLYEGMLHPVQGRLNDYRQQLEQISNLIGQFQETSDYQLQAIAGMQQTIQSLAAAESTPEYAAV